MKARPITLSGDLPVATREGRKTQTRRLFRNPDHHGCLTGDCPHQQQTQCNSALAAACPYGRVGDLLWVREEHYRCGQWEPVTGVETRTGRQKWRFVAESASVYFAPPPTYLSSRPLREPEVRRWYKRRARFMPKLASRTTLEIASVRVERLQDISETDARAEGIYKPLGSQFWYSDPRGSSLPGESPQQAFRNLWESINGPGTWSVNPWVWVIEFKAFDANVEAVLARRAVAA